MKNKTKKRVSNPNAGRDVLEHPKAPFTINLPHEIIVAAGCTPYRKERPNNKVGNNYITINAEYKGLQRTVLNLLKKHYGTE